MRRRILNLVTTLSLLIGVAVCVVWVRSYFRTDTICAVRGRELLYGDSSRGALAFAWQTGGQVAEEPVVLEARAKGWAWHVAPGRDRYMGARRTFGFLWFYAARPGGSVERVLHVPDWAVVLAAAVLPVGRAARWSLRRRPRPGLCPQCGYDLRATPERCPECGAAGSVSSVG